MLHESAQNTGSFYVLYFVPADVSAKLRRRLSKQDDLIAKSIQRDNSREQSITTHPLSQRISINNSHLQDAILGEVIYPAMTKLAER